MMHIVIKNSNSRVSTEENSYQLKPVPEIKFSTIEVENLETEKVLWISQSAQVL